MTATGLLDPEDESNKPTVLHLQIPSQITATSTTWNGNGKGVPSNGSMLDHTAFPELYKCSSSGHLISDHSIESIAGQVTGFCEHCGEKVHMHRFPGGVSSARVRTLIDAVTDEVWVNPEAILLEYNYLTEALEADVVSVKSNVSLMNVARALISARLGGDDGNA